MKPPTGGRVLAAPPTLERVRRITAITIPQPGRRRVGHELGAVRTDSGVADSRAAWIHSGETTAPLCRGIEDELQVSTAEHSFPIRDMSDYKEIPVKPDTKRQLYEQKQYGETWDETLSRLARRADEK